MQQRSFDFLKKNLRIELTRPVLWMLIICIGFQWAIAYTSTRFGIDSDNSNEFFAMGFSPRQPLRLFLIPWLFSWSVHLNSNHLMQNLSLFLILYFLSWKKLTTRAWWTVLTFIQVLTNLSLIIKDQFFSATEPSHLYMGLSTVIFGLMGFLSVSKMPRMRLALLVATTYELYELFTNSSFHETTLVHLISIGIGITIAGLIKHFRLF